MGLCEPLLTALCYFRVMVGGRAHRDSPAEMRRKRSVRRSVMLGISAVLFDFGAHMTSLSLAARTVPPDESIPPAGAALTNATLATLPPKSSTIVTHSPIPTATYQPTPTTAPIAMPRSTP